MVVPAGMTRTQPLHWRAARHRLIRKARKRVILGEERDPGTSPELPASAKCGRHTAWRPLDGETVPRKPGRQKAGGPMLHCGEIRMPPEICEQRLDLGAQARKDRLER
jgi:hypothetical protein